MQIISLVNYKTTILGANLKINTWSRLKRLNFSVGTTIEFSETFEFMQKDLELYCYIF